VGQSFIDIAAPKLAANWFPPNQRTTATAFGRRREENEKEIDVLLLVDRRSGTPVSPSLLFTSLSSFLSQSAPNPLVFLFLGYLPLFSSLLISEVFGPIVVTGPHVTQLLKYELVQAVASSLAGVKEEEKKKRERRTLMNVFRFLLSSCFVGSLSCLHLQVQERRR
jgi:hypothetical protein